MREISFCIALLTQNCSDPKSYRNCGTTQPKAMCEIISIVENPYNYKYCTQSRNRNQILAPPQRLAQIQNMTKQVLLSRVTCSLLDYFGFVTPRIYYSHFRRRIFGRIAFRGPKFRRLHFLRLA